MHKTGVGGIMAGVVVILFGAKIGILSVIDLSDFEDLDDCSDGYL